MGSLTFNVDLIQYINPTEPHIGYAQSNNKKIHTKIIDGNYYDCGTPEEYLDLLKKELL